MAGLAEIVKHEVEQYAAPSFNSQTYAALDDLRQVYVVLSVVDDPTHDRTLPIIVARVVNNKVIVDADNTNKPLVDALLQAGVPRQSVVLAYEGEKV